MNPESKVFRIRRLRTPSLREDENPQTSFPSSLKNREGTLKYSQGRPGQAQEAVSRRGWMILHVLTLV